jgi:hypothetical protein
MDCQTARGLIEEGEPGPALTAHLSHCPECRAELVLQRRISEALAAMPRASAPASLLSQVMAELAPVAPPAPVLRRLPLLRLRTAEAVWLGALFLVSTVAAWLLGSSATLLGWNSVAATVRQAEHWPRVALSVWTPVAMDGSLRWDSDTGLLHAVMASVSRAPSSWTLALVGFAISLLWLLARHGDFRPRPDWEDAHA